MTRSDHRPLAERMRPTTLEQVMGQEGVIGPGRILTQALAAERIPSMIFWGPPGCGKTTLARIIATTAKYHFEALSAVMAGVKEVRAVVERAEQMAKLDGQGTILFVDEIHRFNKGQQDAFLPYVEKGVIVLLGATTENPSFEINGALLSRCRVVVLKPLDREALIQLLQRAVQDADCGYGANPIAMAEEVYPCIADLADGDARYALNCLESLIELSGPARAAGATLGVAELQASLQRRPLPYDGEEHYNLISALHKSLRGSDPDASLYWLARMLAGGEDGLFIARRLVRFASEDVGNADPQALTIALNAKEAFHFLGQPEGELALAQAAVYLATAPKSNSLYRAYGAAQEAARTRGALPPPLAIRNAPTRLMKELEYGKGYRYAHDYEGGYVAQEYLPEPLRGTQFYQPVERGFEREIAKRLAFWRKLKEDGHP